MTRPVWSVLVLLAAAPAATAAGPDVADLFPADTLAYVELREPGKVAPQLAAAFANTPLADLARFVDDRRAASKSSHDLLGKPELAVLGLLATPELAAEAGRLGGVAAGLTGFTPQGEPEAVLAVATGDSAAAGLAARGFLALASVRRVGDVHGVSVYQFRTPRLTFDPATGQQRLDNDRPPEEGAYEATAAYTPGLFVYGTSKAAVAAVVTRFRGKGGAGLGGGTAYKAARAAHPHYGLFVYADAAAILARQDEARRASGGPEPDALGWVRMLAGGRAVRSIAGVVRFRDGGLAAELTASFAPDRPSPLLALLSGPPVKGGFATEAPASAAFAATLALPERERAKAVLGFLDAAAMATGRLGRTPGETARSIETRFKLPVADRLIGRTRAVTVLVPRWSHGGAGVAAAPAVVLHAESAEAATAWEEALPKLAAGLGGGEPAPPSSEKLGAETVWSVPGADLPWKSALHYARKDTAVAVGLDRAVVVAAVSAVSGAAPADGAAGMVGFCRIGGAVREVLTTTPPTGPITTTPLPPRPGNLPTLPGPPAEGQLKTEERLLADVWAALDRLPPAAFTARRDGNDLRVELVQRPGPDGFAPVIAAAVAWFDVYLNRGAGLPPGGVGRFGGIR